MIAKSTRITPAIRKTIGRFKLKLRGGELDNQNCGNTMPAPAKSSRTRYGKTNPMTKPGIYGLVVPFGRGPIQRIGPRGETADNRQGSPGTFTDPRALVLARKTRPSSS